MFGSELCLSGSLPRCHADLKSESHILAAQTPLLNVLMTPSGPHWEMRLNVDISYCLCLDCLKAFAKADIYMKPLRCLFLIIMVFRSFLGFKMKRNA